MTMTIMTSLLYTTATLLLTAFVGSLSADTQIFISARVGSSAVLPCDCRNVSTQSPHVEWRTISETVFERRGGQLYQGEGYEDRVDVPEDHLLKGDSSLELKNVRPEDEGIYESHLLVKRTKGAAASKWVFSPECGALGRCLEDSHCIGSGHVPELGQGSKLELKLGLRAKTVRKSNAYTAAERLP
ncbi:hypothetical protein AOLI_G00188360 [Acnodon oligacanthus]